MGGVVNSIASGVSSVTNAVDRATGTNIGSFHKDMRDPFGVFDSPAEGPKPPGTPSNLTELQARQREQAQQFRGNLNQTKQSQASQLRGQAAQKLQGDMGDLKESQASKGTMYGGVGAGQRSKLRAGAQGGLNRAINQSNVGLDNAANVMEAQAIDTAFGIQQSQQQVQNMIYQQALMQMNAQNQIAGSAMGTGMGLLIGRAG